MIGDEFFSMEVNSAAFEQAMQRLRTGIRAGLIDPKFGTLPVQARLLAERCQTLTPPRSSKQGRDAVARDILGIFKPLQQSTWRDKSIRKIIRTDDRPAWAALSANFSKDTGLRNTTAISFAPALHQRMRNRRGFIGRGARKTGAVTLGPEARRVKAYLRETQKRVGWAKAGWNLAIRRLGGVVAAAWIASKGDAGGTVTIDSSSSNPAIFVGNRTSWAGARGNEARRIVRTAIASRARDMQNYLERMMRLAVQKAGG